MTAGSLSFLALIATCFVLARHYQRRGERGMAIGSRVVGAFFLACLAASGGPDGSLTLFVGVCTAMLWVAFALRQMMVTQPALRTGTLPTTGTQRPIEQFG